MEAPTIIALGALLLTGFGMLAGAMRYQSTRLQATADALHQRINQFKDHVAKTYVTKELYEREHDRIRDDLQKMDSKLDRLLAAVTKTTMPAE